MEGNKKIIKQNNKRKIKHFKTESALKSKDLSKISPLKKKIINQFNYRLFKLNENYRLFNNNIPHCNSRDLFSNIKVKNYSNNSIKNINITNTNSKKNYFNNNYSKTSNYINSQYYPSKSNFNKHIQKNKYYFSKTNDSKSQKKFDNRIENKLNVCLIPLYYLNKNKDSKLKKRKKILENNFYNDKGELYKNNNDIDILSRTNYTNFKGALLKKNNNFLKIRMKTNMDSRTDENDMKPKFRFINLKKDLLEENLKINKMFAEFNREISEKEKSLKFIGKYKTKTEWKMDNE